MEFFLGLFTAIVFFCAVLSAHYAGVRTGKKTVAPKPLDKEKQHELERLNKGFQELFTYDVSKALEKKKVT